MLRLVFHVNQRGLKRLHWSTSSRLTAPPQPISRRGAVTSLQCASLAADAQCSVHLYRWKWITVSWETYFRTGHCYMSVCHCCTPAWRSVNVKWAVLWPVVVIFTCIYSLIWPHREREQPQYAPASWSHRYMCLACPYLTNNKSYGYYC